MQTKKIAAYQPYKRLVTLSILAIPLTILSYMGNSRTWYTFSFQAEKMYLPDTYAQLNSVFAVEKYNAYDLMSSDMVNTVYGPAPALIGVQGLPVTTVLMLLGTLLLILGALMRLTLLPVVGLLVFNAARRYIDRMRSLVEDPNFSGDYMSPTEVIAQQYFLHTIAIILSLLIIAQIVYVNYKKKTKTENKSTFDILTSAYTSVFNRVLLEKTKEKEKV